MIIIKQMKYYVNCVKTLEFIRLNCVFFRCIQMDLLWNPFRIRSALKNEYYFISQRIFIVYDSQKIHAIRQVIAFIFQLYSFYDTAIISCCVLFSF